MTFGLLAFFVYRTFLKSDKPAALVLMLGLMIILEDYLQKAIYIPGLKVGSVRFSEIFIVYLLIKDYRKKQRYEKYESKTIDSLWIPFILLFLISVFVSHHKFIAARNFRFCILDPFLVYLIACHGFDNEDDYKRFAIYLGVLVFLLAAASIDDLKFHRIWFRGPMRIKYEFFGKEFKGRYGSFFLNPNFFASFLVLSLPIVFTSILYFKRREKYISLFSLLAGILALILTWTRSVYVAFAAGVLFSSYYGLLKVVNFRKIVLLLFMIIGLVGAVFPGAMNKIFYRASTTIEEQIGDSKVEHSRLEIWRHALELLKRHPFIGIGLTETDYRLSARHEIGGGYVYKKGARRSVSGFGDQPHNSYISLALWVSPFSVIIFLMMNYRVLKLGRNVIKNPDAQAYYKLFSFSAGVAIFCYLVVIFFDTQLLVRTVNSLYWLLFGLLISVYRRVESEKTILTA